MRPLPQTRFQVSSHEKEDSILHHLTLVLVLLTTGAWTLGCGGGGAGSVAPPTSPPPSIQTEITPRSGTVLLGETLSFTATVNNSTNASVQWSVNGINGGSSQVGLISADGVYTAPADLPPGGTVQVRATSNADSSSFATASVTISSDIAVSLSPGISNVDLGSVQSFHASIVSSGRPDLTIRWSVSGSACPVSCGSVDANGNYVAPQVLPNPVSLTIMATSAADSSKQAIASVVIASDFQLQVTGPTSLQPGVTAAFVATMTPAPNSNPSTALSWSLSGTGCSGGACGILSVAATQALGAPSVANTANYTAPPSAPQPDAVTVTVTPSADPTKKSRLSSQSKRMERVG
jgi:hypothetical protein